MMLPYLLTLLWRRCGGRSVNEEIVSDKDEEVNDE